MSAHSKDPEGENKGSVAHVETPVHGKSAPHVDAEYHHHHHHHHHHEVKGDAALKILGDAHRRVQMTDEQVSSIALDNFLSLFIHIPYNHAAQSEIVKRKIDRRILPILMWVYFLQVSFAGPVVTQR